MKINWPLVMLIAMISLLMVFIFSGDDTQGGFVYSDNLNQNLNSTNNVTFKNITTEAVFVNGGVGASTHNYFETMKTECMGNSNFAPFSNAAISSGTVSVVNAIDIDHQGIVYLRDSTTAGGGYYIGTTSTSAIILQPGYSGKFIFQDVSSRLGTHVKFGFIDSATVGDPAIDSDAVAVYIDPYTNDLHAYCRNGTSIALSATNYTISNSVWYRLEINVLSSKLANFKLYNSSILNNLLWESNITTNIPIGGGSARATGFKALAGQNSTDAAANIIYLDYMELSINRRLDR